MAKQNKGNATFELNLAIALCTAGIAAAAALIYYQATHHVSKALPHAMNMAATSGSYGNPVLDMLGTILVLVILIALISAAANSNNYHYRNRSSAGSYLPLLATAAVISSVCNQPQVNVHGRSPSGVGVNGNNGWHRTSNMGMFNSNVPNNGQSTHHIGGNNHQRAPH